MGLLEKEIKIDKNGNVSYIGWIEWNHISMGKAHCPICLVLDKCWFKNSKKPELPQHENCHCDVTYIPQPLPNVNAKAECNIKKFSHYVFDDNYLQNGKKALFESLGFTINDSEYLKKEYEKQAVQKYCNGEYELNLLNEYGQRINIEINLNKNGRDIKFITGWLVKPKGKIVNTTPLAD